MGDAVYSDIDVKNIIFKRDDLNFKAKLTAPSDPSLCRGVVVFIHGLGYCYKSYNIDDKLFAKSGWAFLRYNVRGHLGADGEWTIQDSVDDLRTCLDFLGNEPYLQNQHNIGFFAHSTGGLIALLAHIKDRRFKFGSVTNLITSLKVSYYWWFKSGYNKDVQHYFSLKGKTIDPKVKDFFDDDKWFSNVEENKLDKDEYSFPYKYGFLKGNSFYTFLYEIRNSPDILQSAENIGIPIIMFKSKSDEVIENIVSDKFYKAIASQNKKIIEVEPEMGTLKHFLMKSWPEIEVNTISFFNDHFDKRLI